MQPASRSPRSLARSGIAASERNEPPRRGSAGEPADAVADQLRADHQAEHGHDRGVIGRPSTSLSSVEDAGWLDRPSRSRSRPGCPDRGCRSPRTPRARAPDPRCSTPVWAIAAAAPTVSRRFFGLTADSASAIAAERAGREAVDRLHPLRQRRSASRAGASAPLARRHAQQQHAQHDLERCSPSRAGAPWSEASAPLEIRSTMAPAAESPTIQPRMKAGPFGPTRAACRASAPRR